MMKKDMLEDIPTDSINQLTGLGNGHTDTSGNEIGAVKSQSRLEVFKSLEFDVSETFGLAVMASDHANAGERSRGEEVGQVSFSGLVVQVADVGGKWRRSRQRDFGTVKSASFPA